MSQSRRQLIASIAIQDKRLQKQQAEVIEHKHYLAAVAQQHRLSALILIIPAFLGGWSIGRKSSIRRVVKQISKISMLAATTHLKNQLFHAISRASSA